MHVVISRVPCRYVFSEQVVVFGSDSFAWLAVLQSRLHEVWVQRFGTRLGEGLRYSATKCLETFPFPPDEALKPGSALEDAGRLLYEARAKYMADEDVGPTTTYNRLKEPENGEPRIVALRALHEEADRLVLGAYGWSDLEVPAYASVDEVESFQERALERLFVLNERRSTAAAAPPGPSVARAKVRTSTKRAARSAR
jgi:hypothetical protein